MPSLVHETLVDLIKNWIEKEYNEIDGQIAIDDKTLGAARPFPIEGFIPDLFCYFPKTNHTIIADAKTPKDLETSHTANQLKAYVKYLMLQNGTTELIIATRYLWAPSAKSLLRSIAKNLEPVKAKNSLPQITIISDLGRS